VVETRRSHTLGRVYWQGTTQPDSGQPEGDPRRVLRAPADGALVSRAKIGEHVQEGQVVAVVGDQSRGLKIGDVDPRDDADSCYLVSDKALSIGGAALEAILTREEIRKGLWQ
jgi:xanthine dehydrogenase accessory factor